MGLDPNSSNQDSLPSLRFVDIGDDSFVALEFQRQIDLVDVVFSIEVSTDLENWSESAILFGDPSPIENGNEVVVLRHNLPIVGEDLRQMIRLKVRRP